MIEDNYKLIANNVVQLERLGAFDESDMKYIRLHAFSSVVNKRTVLKPEHVAELLGVSPQSVRTWCRDGKVEAWKDADGWWEMPLGSVHELKITNMNFDEWNDMDIKKVDF